MGKVIQIVLITLFLFNVIFLIQCTQDITDSQENIIKRQVYGKLLTSEKTFKRIEAVISGDSTYISELWYNTATFGFTGFAYFGKNTNSTSYSVYVKVFNRDSLFTGRSPTVTFNDLAGDIEIPSFNPYNAVSIPNAGVDFSTSVNDSMLLYGSAIDSFGGTIVKWEWDAGNTGVFSETTPDSNFIAIAPSASNSTYQCVLKVTDNDGNIALDTVTVNVLTDAPIPTASTTTPTVSINDTIRLQGTATDVYGRIVKWEWDAGNTGTFIETTPDSNYTTVAPSTPNNTFQCVLKVTDDDNNTIFDTILIKNVLQDRPVPTASTTTPTVSINDTIRLQGTAADVFGTIVKWEWDAGNTGVFTETTPDSSFNTIAPSTGPINNQYVLKVTDDDDNVAKDTITIVVFGNLIDIDGNVYHTVKIGNQEWTVENLRTTKYNDGTAIPLVPDSGAWTSSTTPKYCYYNNTTNTDSIEKYGALYNWQTVNSGKLAPEGWHVPADAEWTELENYLIANGYNWDGTTSGNKIAKSMAAKTDWNSSSLQGSPGNNMQTNNSTGFSALPGGCRYNNGNFHSFGSLGSWWSATEDDASYAYYRSFYCGSDYLRRDRQLKAYGFSVRLLRD